MVCFRTRSSSRGSFVQALFPHCGNLERGSLNPLIFVLALAIIGPFPATTLPSPLKGVVPIPTRFYPRAAAIPTDSGAFIRSDSLRNRARTYRGYMRGLASRCQFYYRSNEHYPAPPDPYRIGESPPIHSRVLISPPPMAGLSPTSHQSCANLTVPPHLYRAGIRGARGVLTCHAPQSHEVTSREGLTRAALRPLIRR